MMHKPWYLWTSVFGFMALFFLMGVKTMRRLMQHDKAAFARWLPSFGVAMGLWVGCLMLPGRLLSSVLGAFAPRLSGLVFLYIYIIGVLMTYWLDKWKKDRFDGYKEPVS